MTTLLYVCLFGGLYLTPHLTIQTLLILEFIRNMRLPFNIWSRTVEDEIAIFNTHNWQQIQEMEQYIWPEGTGATEVYHH